VRLVPEQVIGEQRADLVAGQHPPAGGAGDHGGEPVRVGVVGQQQIRAAPLTFGQQQIEDARFLRVGSGQRRERPVRLGLRGHHGGLGKPSPGERLTDRGQAHPCSGV